MSHALGMEVKSSKPSIAVDCWNYFTFFPKVQNPPAVSLATPVNKWKVAASFDDSEGGEPHEDPRERSDRADGLGFKGRLK